MRQIPKIIGQQYQKLFSSLGAGKASFADVLKKTAGAERLHCKHLLSTDDMSARDLELLFRVAYAFRHYFLNKPGQKLGLLPGLRIINFFAEESTRTRSGFELAGKQLGADVINVSADSSSMAKKGESFADTVRTFRQLKADCIVIRDKRSGAPAFVAKEMPMPVINAGDGWHEHPTQALLDAYTIAEEFGDLKGRTIAIIGDILHSRVAGSQMRLFRTLGARVRLVGPQTLLPPAAAAVFGVKVYTDMDAAIAGADVLSVLRIQLERAAGSFIPSVRDYSKQYCVNRARLKLAAPHAIVIHPGPINRETDLTTDVMESSQSRVEAQITNGLAMRMAFLYLLLR